MSQGGREVVIVDAIRTPIGRGHAEKGQYRDVHPVDLLGQTYSALLDHSGVDPKEVEYVIGGCVQQVGEQSFDVARNAWLHEDLPIEASASSIDLQCGSAQQATGIGAALIAAGIHDVVIGSGVESMSRIPFSAGDRIQAEFGSPNTEQMMKNHDVRGQGIGAELIADEWGITREQLDEFGVRSHALAHAASEGGKFTRESLTVKTPQGDVTTDQGIRPGTDLAGLSALRPVFKEDGKVTAGTSSQISDGAAAVMLMAADKAESLGLTPRAKIVDQVSVGCDPVKMLEGPIPATARILERNGISIGDIDRFEVNEAFAPVVLAWALAHSPDMDRVNSRGGAIALGHPLGSTGARLLTTLLHNLEDEDEEIGLVTMCCGGGIGTGTLIQRI